MAYNMNGSPAKLGTIQGTAGHSSALKLKQDKKRTIKSDMKEKDTREFAEPSVKEQLELRNNNTELKAQCAKNGGIWDSATGTCKPEPKK